MIQYDTLLLKFQPIFYLRSRSSYYRVLRKHLYLDHVFMNEDSQNTPYKIKITLLSHRIPLLTNLVALFIVVLVSLYKEV